MNLNYEIAKIIIKKIYLKKFEFFEKDLKLLGNSQKETNIAVLIINAAFVINTKLLKVNFYQLSFYFFVKI